MNGLVYSYDLHWLVNPNQIKSMNIIDLFNTHAIQIYMYDEEFGRIIFKGTKEECERRLNDFVVSLKVGLAPKILRF